MIPAFQLQDAKLVVQLPKQIVNPAWVTPDRLDLRVSFKKEFSSEF